MTEILNIKNIHRAAKIELEKAEARRNGNTANKLERSPVSDVVKITNNAPVNNVSKTTKTVKDLTAETQKKLDEVKKEKILTNEVIHFLQPKVDSKGAKSFTSAQIRIIDAAQNKIKFFKALSKELEADAQKYGDEVLEDMTEIFGGEEGLGKYLVVRKKDSTSIYNKLVKEFKNERIKSDVHNMFAKKLYDKRYSMLDKDEKELVRIWIEEGDLKLDAKDFKVIEDAFKSDPKEHFAQKMYLKSYSSLNKDEKNNVKNAFFNSNDAYVTNATTKQARHEAINYVRDLVGVRLILPTGSRAEMTKVEKYIDKAVATGKMKITRMSNYHANHILPYVKKEKALMWKELIPGMELVETSEVRKRNGYTTTQMNLEHKVKGRERPVMVEFQLRTESLNYIGQIEHLIYDILEKKDISKGIFQLKEYYDSIGIVKAVNELFNDEMKETKYTDYERAYYSYIRNNEIGGKAKIDKPLLAEFGLGEFEHSLSFDALDEINEKALALKEKFGPKDSLSPKKTNKK